MIKKLVPTPERLIYPQLWKHSGPFGASYSLLAQPSKQDYSCEDKSKRNLHPVGKDTNVIYKQMKLYKCEHPLAPELFSCCCSKSKIAQTFSRKREYYLSLIGSEK